MAIKTARGAVHAQIAHVYIARNRSRDVKPGAQDPAIPEPKISLRIQGYCSGVSAGTESIEGSGSEPVIFPGRECLLDLDGGGGHPAVFVKLGQTILTKQADVAQLDSGTGAVANFVVANDRNDSDRELVG